MPGAQTSTPKIADRRAPAVLAHSPALPVRTRCCRTDAAAPAVHALTLELVMRHFFLGFVVLAHFSLPCVSVSSLPACRFPLAPALSARAQLLAMPTLALSPASAPTTAPSFSVTVLPLLRVALALVLNGLAFLSGLASLGGYGLTDAWRGGRSAMPSLGGRWSARGTSLVGGTAGLCSLAIPSTQPQTMAEHAVVALSPSTKGAA